MTPKLLSVAVSLLVIGALFTLFERLWPSLPRPFRWRPGTHTDLTYWFFTPLITKALTRLTIYGGFAILVWLIGRTTVQGWLHPQGLLARQPYPLQAVEVVLVGDFIGYWMHRFFHHSAWLWRFHAIHHSSPDLDWLSSVRLHPVNDLLTRLAQVVPFVALGFSHGVMAAYVPFLSLYAIFLHANVRWSFGKLKWVIASPTFHRWHHTCDEEGLNKNFAGLFAIFDWLFGTFYMPEGAQPARFGVRSEQIPQSFLPQLAYPFRKQASNRA